MAVVVASQRIAVAGAFDEGAVGAAVSVVALAAVLVHGVPGAVVLGGGVFRAHAVVILGEVEERLAGAVSVAVVRAGGAAAALSPESVEALALTGLAVAVTLATALNQVLVIVVLGGRACPRVTLGACAEGAIGTGPGRHDSGLGELVGVSAGGVVVLTARVARARVLGGEGAGTVSTGYSCMIQTVLN